MKLLLQPLLNKRPDLAFHRQLLFFSPFTHYFRGVLFDQSHWGDSFRVTPIASILADGIDVRGHLILPMGLFRRPFMAPWDDKSRISQELCEHLEKETLPMIAPMDNPRALISRSEWMYPMGTAGVACLLGDYERAHELLDDMGHVIEGSVTDHRHDDYGWRRMYLRHLIETDRSKIPEQLFAWERQAVVESKLTKYWKPTPFGVET